MTEEDWIKELSRKAIEAGILVGEDELDEAIHFCKNNGRGSLWVSIRNDDHNIHFHGDNLITGEETCFETEPLLVTVDWMLQRMKEVYE